MRWWWVMLFACRGCEACRPDVVPVDTGDFADHTDDTDPIDTDVDTDTDLPPPCDQPEIEPNGLDDPNPIVMERYACGSFDPAFDVDARTVDVPRPMWLMIRVDGRSIGRADPMLILSAEDGEAAQASARDDGFEDPILVFPSTAQTYTLIVTDEAGQGGPDNYPYRMMVAEAKAPVDFDDSEPEAPHGSRAEAAPMALGTSIFGDMSTSSESDWYELTVPAGKQTLRLWIDAFAYGSGGDFAIQVYDDGGRKVDETYYGEYGWEHDPWLEYTSSGSETLYVRVSESGGRAGRAYWYALHTSVEEE